MKNIFRSHYFFALAISISSAQLHAYYTYTIYSPELSAFLAQEASKEGTANSEIKMLAKSLAKEKAQNNLLTKKLEAAQNDCATAKAGWRSCNKALQQLKKKHAKLKAKSESQFYRDSFVSIVLASAAWNHQAILAWLTSKATT